MIAMLATTDEGESMSFSEAFGMMNAGDNPFTDEFVEAEAQDLANAVRGTGAPLNEAELELDAHDPAIAARVRARAAELLALE
jgi:hypothetical protein